MPQMAPLNWLFLFFYFISIFFMFNILNYFIFLKTPLDKKTSLKFNSINWKW
uniref:ATP synthase complex subunit 8 n=1 Tax=Clambus sp. CLA01 TaxID=1205546 RepID=A0A0S2MN05_9COLE|nr:ATP synthase F0 subunit 8 [Clambus sp. CLA01]